MITAKEVKKEVDSLVKMGAISKRKANKTVKQSSSFMNEANNCGMSVTDFVDMIMSF